MKQLTKKLKLECIDYLINIYKNGTNESMFICINYNEWYGKRYKFKNSNSLSQWIVRFKELNDAIITELSKQYNLHVNNANSLPFKTGYISPNFRLKLLMNIKRKLTLNSMRNK